MNPPASRPEDRLPIVARLFVTAGVGGRFAQPVCEDGQTLTPSDYARRAMATAAARGSDQHPIAPLVVDTGGLLAPHGVAMFAAREQPDAYARLIADLGYEAIALGESEVSAPREPMVATLTALRERGVATIASNLRCDPEVPTAAALCDQVVDASDGVAMIRRGDETIALLTFLADDTLDRVSPERARGLRLSPVADSLGPAVVAARDRGATLVFAIVDDGWGADAGARVVSLTETLDDRAKPDLVFAANAGSELLFARPVSFRPAVTAAPPGGGTFVRVRRNRETETLDVLARPVTLPTEPTDPPEALTQFIDTVGDDYCAAWGGPLAGAALSEPIDGGGLLNLAAGVMRERADAEIALLNRGILDARWRPRRADQLHASDLHVAIQYDEPLVVAHVPTAWITQVARTSASREELLALGITITNPGAANETIKVNGRPLVTNGSYHVVTIRFLASGGDGLLPEGPEWEPLEVSTDEDTDEALDEIGSDADRPESLRSAMLTYLSNAPDGDADAAERDPRARISDPANDAEWVLRVDGEIAFGGSSVNNPGAYDDTQLQRENTAALGLGLDVAATAQSPNFAWDNAFSMAYRLARTSESDGRYDEGNDLIYYRTTARWRRFRVRTADWYVPEPYFEGYVETEFTEPATREFRHFLIRSTVGTQFTLTTKLSFKASAGFEVQAFDPNRDVLPGAGIQLLLAPYTLIKTPSQSVTFDFTLDWFVSDLGGLNRRALRGKTNLSVLFSQRFALTMTLDIFGVRSDGGPFSFASNVTAAARVSWLGRSVR